MDDRQTGRGFGAWVLAAALAALPAAAQADDTLRVGVISQPPGKGNVAQSWNVTPNIYTMSPVFDTLTSVDQFGTVAGHLAVAWWPVDRTTWHIKLRPAVAFSNGEPLTAQGIADYYAWLFTAGAGTSAGINFRNWTAYESARALDDLTLEFKTRNPNAVLPQTAAMTYFPAPKAWRELGPEGFANNPVGSGSFKVESWTPGAVKMAANASSWRRPLIPKLDIVTLPDAAARTQALLGGQIDIAVAQPFDSIDQLQKAGFQTLITPRTVVMAWALFQTSRESPMNDKRVRQALNYAVNKERIATDLLRGLTVPASQGATRFMEGYNPELKPYPYDPAMAKKLLAEAGYPNGFAATAHVLPGNMPMDNEIYQQVARDLTAVGIKLDLQAIAFGKWMQSFIPGPDAKTLGFEGDIFQSDYYMQATDPLAEYASKSCIKKPAFYCDPEEQKLIEAAQQEADLGKRRALVQKLLATSRDNAQTLYLFEVIDLIGVSPKVTGLANINQWLTYHQVLKMN